MITNKGHIIKANINTLNKLKKKLIIIEEIRVGRKILGYDKTNLYIMSKLEGETILIVPQYVMNCEYMDDNNFLIPYDSIDISCNITLRPRQQYIMDYIYDKFMAHPYPTSVCLKLKAGIGKSFISASLIHKLQAKTIIIVPNEVVLNNWIDKILTADLFPNATIGKLYGKCKEDGDIVVAVINSVIKDEIMGIYPTKYLSKFGFIIMDEVHKYVSEKRIKIFWRTCLKYKLAMSASLETPINNEYKCNKTRIIKAFCGKVIDMNYLYHDDEKQFDGKVIRVNYHNNIEVIRNSHGFVDFGEMVQQFAKDDKRNKIILLYIKKLLASNHNILVFVENIDHCNYLYRQAIRLLTYTSMNNIAEKTIKLKGGACKADITTAYDSKLIICTYGYGKEGMSYDQLDAMILGTPRRNGAEQFVARILRSGGDYSIKRIIIDIVDQCSNNFKTQFYDRKKFYDNLSFEIKQIHYYNS